MILAMSPQISHGLFGFLLTADLTLRECNDSLVQAICRMGICLSNMPQTSFFFLIGNHIDTEEQTSIFSYDQNVQKLF